MVFDAGCLAYLKLSDRQIVLDVRSQAVDVRNSGHYPFDRFQKRMMALLRCQTRNDRELVGAGLLCAMIWILNRIDAVVDSLHRRRVRSSRPRAN